MKQRIRQCGLLLLGIALLLTGTTAAAERQERLVLAGPPAAVSFPLIRMVESGALDDIAEQVEYVEWRDPDQVRALLLRGNVDFVALPSNVAANLHNRGIDLQLLNISSWGLLWVVSRDAELDSLADLAGKEIAVPFRGDMPDVVLRELLRANGLDERRDLRLRYVASPMDAMQLLIVRRVDHALLSEPAASMALYQTQGAALSQIVPELHRAIDLQQAWGETFERESRIPQAGLSAVGELSPALRSRVQHEYAAALEWVLANPEAAGEMVARHSGMLKPPAVVDAIAHSQLRAVPAAVARAELEHFYSVLERTTPALIGGQLPPERFYFDE
ncbi:ABC transporter substrate-binding protein [Alkalilimnicola ehrlichii]|uniref:ABC transporter substrate-binding protein n=1 Tax=Alkalilimnicola ehrlichii TaxID=351052 RepID=A0A3E0WNS7_9GAMM|nr:PhnD/SsuA/transferrin family substrate-binding protein [Alkalilimnicola ehrlichii]RFA27965.1 ABC transporter substrate-binding protein [Alkalilimnicola ehrlichii]RFA34612.1 ABC transporter substrate-binding protein [Alkalilimnicola ehrlichii]